MKGLYQAALALNGEPAQDRATACRVAEAFGWTVDESAAIDFGLWMCNITDEDAAELDEHGAVDRNCEQGDDFLEAAVEMP